MKRDFGFTLVESLITIAVFSVIFSTVVIFLPYYKRNVEMDEQTRIVVSYLRQAQVKAMTGEDNKDWGIRFRNPAGDDYFEVYSTATNYAGGSVQETIYLSNYLEFSDPSQATGYKDIQFGKIRGTIASASSIILKTKANNATQTISVEMSGMVTY